jgi:hypothetical protein
MSSNKSYTQRVIYEESWDLEVVEVEREEEFTLRQPTNHCFARFVVPENENCKRYTGQPMNEQERTCSKNTIQRRNINDNRCQGKFNQKAQE